MGVFNFFRRKPEKVDPPSERGIIKLSNQAKDENQDKDECKIIEYHNNGSVKRIKYSEAEVEVLREKGVPVEYEMDSGKFDFVEMEAEGGIDHIRRI